MPPKIQPKLEEIQNHISDSPRIIPSLNEIKYQSLESLLSNTKNDPPTDPINHIWQDKLKLVRFKMSSLLNALNLRDQIKQDSLYDINQDICKIHTLQFAMANDSSLGKYTSNKYHLGLEKAVGNLERDKRSEVLSCWKDTVMMRKDLVDALREYMSLKRKMSLLGLRMNTKYND